MKDVMPAKFKYPHLIHPTTLDSVFHMQALGYLHSLSGEESLVPISIESIYNDADIATAPGTVFQGYSKGTQSRSGDTIGDIVLTDDEMSRPKVVVRGFLSRDLSASTPTGNALAADSRPRKCTNKQFVPLRTAPAELEEDSLVLAAEEKEHTKSSDNSNDIVLPSMKDLVVLHNSAASKDLSGSTQVLLSKLAAISNKVTTLSIEEITFGDESNLKGKVVISLIEAEGHFVSHWTEKQFNIFRNIVSAVECLLWVTRGASIEGEAGLTFNLTAGLIRTVRVEKPQLRIFQLDLGSGSNALTGHEADLILEVFETSILTPAKAVEQEFVEIDGKLHVPRLVTDESFHDELNPFGANPDLVEQQVSELDEAVRGIIPEFQETIRFIRHEVEPLGEHGIELAPSMVTLDASAFEHRETLGQDAIGTITSVGTSVTDLAIGDRVIVCASDTLQLPLRVHSDLAKVLPSFLNAAATVTMPTSLTTAQLALVELGRLQPGESVLIVAAADPNGLALVQLASSLGARVFASFESAQHRSLLLDHMDMDEQQLIMTTKGGKFAEKLFQLNAQRGVDVLVICTPGDISYQSSSCLAPFGRWITLGARQSLSSAMPLERGITISNLDLEHLRQAAPERVGKAWQQVWAMAKRGIFHSMLPRRPLDISMFTEVKTIPTSLKRPGGAVISIRDDSRLLVVPPPPASLTLNADATYVLAGGLGGIGRSLAESLFMAGARRIVFISRYGAKTDEAKKLLSSLQQRGCTAKAYSCDVSSATAVEAFAFHAGNPARTKLSAASFGDFQPAKHKSNEGSQGSHVSTIHKPSAATLVGNESVKYKLSAASFGDWQQTGQTTRAEPSKERLNLEVASAAASSQDIDTAFSSAATGGQQIAKWRFICLSISLCIGLFLSFLDGSITATALYTIGVEFSCLTSITWIAVAYTLSDVGFATIFTAVADIIGRFNAYLLAQTIFMAFSFACGFAKTFNQLIAFRVLQGIGGSGLYSLAMVIWPEMSTLALKKWIGAFVGLVVAAAGVAGPLVGGVITSDISWRWIFWINPPIVVVSTTLFVVAWPRGKQVRSHEKNSFQSLDVKGGASLVAGCLLPVVAFQEMGAHAGAWSQGLFIGPLVGGLGSWLLLIGWEFYITKWNTVRFNPIFPPHLLASRRYAANAANSLLIGFLFFVAIYYVPLHLQTVNGRTPLGAGVALLPMLCSAAFGSFLAGALSSGMDLLCPSITAGSALMAMGLGLLSTLSESTHIPTKLYGFQVLIGLGFGLTVSSSSILANVECELRDHAVAQGIVAQARVFGGSLGIATGTAVQGLRIRKQLALTGILSSSELQSLYGSSHSLSSAQLDAVRHTYASSFRITMRIAAIIGCVAFLSALATYDNSKIPLPNRIVLQEQREDDRIAKLHREKEMESRMKAQGSGVTTPGPVDQDVEKRA